MKAIGGTPPGALDIASGIAWFQLIGTRLEQDPTLCKFP
jgi:hypothetical protein